mmetsp:Transcript_36179/g.92109  ORF Transcript_36179/g.92109 Transcript_36179/m.92109 type:complete len:202 (-) Transcript_36179:122-727(-)
MRVLMRSIRAWFKFSSAMKVGYCTSKQRSTPRFKVRNNAGKVRVTPTEELRCCPSKTDHNSWAAVNIADNASSVSCWSFSDRLTPSTSQYSKCDNKPISLNTSGTSKLTRTEWNILTSFFKVSRSNGKQFVIHWTVLFRTSSKPTEIGWETFLHIVSGTLRSSGPCGAQGVSESCPPLCFTNRSHAKGRMNLLRRDTNSWR